MRKDPVPDERAINFLCFYSLMSQPAFSNVVSLVAQRLNSTTQPTRADDQKLRLAMWDLHNQMPGDGQIFDIWQAMNSAKRDQERFEQTFARLVRYLQSAGLHGTAVTAPVPQVAKAFYAVNMNSRQQERVINMMPNVLSVSPGTNSQIGLREPGQSPPLPRHQQAPSGMNSNARCFGS